MAKFRKKPVVIEAVKWTGDNYEEMRKFVKLDAEIGLDNMYIYTLEGVMKAEKGDFIIKGVNGEFYPCKPDIFEATYERVDD